jgi:hypothetical protein
VHFSFIFILYIIHYIYIYVYENLHLSLRTHSNDTRTNLNHKIKNKPCPCFIIFHIKIILYTYYLVYGCIIIITFVAIHIWAVSRLNCIQRARKWVNAFFLQFFFPAIDCPDDWWQLCGVGVSCHCLRSFFFFFYIR